jgi:hypothetical protein
MRRSLVLAGGFGIGAVMAIFGKKRYDIIIHLVQSLKYSRIAFLTNLK